MMMTINAGIAFARRLLERKNASTPCLALFLCLAACGPPPPPAEDADDVAPADDVALADDGDEDLPDAVDPDDDEVAAADAWDPDVDPEALSLPLPEPGKLAALVGVTTTTGFPGHFASPSIVREGNKLHVYLAKQTIGGRTYHVPHAIYTAAHGWRLAGDALPHLGTNAAQNGVVWAPGVARIDATHWVLFYTAHTTNSTGEKKCIWRAVSNDASGPFVDNFDGPMVCPDGSQWAIDAYPVKDENGRWFLGARIDEPGGINTIQIRKLTASGRHFAAGSAWVRLTHNAPDSWEQPVLENAGIVRLQPRGKPAHWFVFYSGGAWADNRYAIGYADCGRILDNGPCRKVTTTGPWLKTRPSRDLFGPGTPTFYRDEDGAQLMSIQAWRYSGGTSNPDNHGQIMRTYEIAVDDQYRPSVRLRRVDR